MGERVLLVAEDEKEVLATHACGYWHEAGMEAGLGGCRCCWGRSGSGQGLPGGREAFEREVMDGIRREGRKGLVVNEIERAVREGKLG